MDISEYEGGEVMWQAETFLGRLGNRKAFLETTVIQYPATLAYKAFSAAECVLTLKPHVTEIGTVSEIKIGFVVDSDTGCTESLDVFRRLIDEVEHKLSLGASERG